ncbi:MAG: hypothetical protein IPJ75_08710 [Ignavibacteriales bacterium]|nr:hypothetical protein [Ignavibacteriales bacterium]
MGLNGTLNALEVTSGGKTGKNNPISVSSVESQKSNLFLAPGAGGSVIVIWADSRKDDSGIYGQMIGGK